MAGCDVAIVGGGVAGGAAACAFARHGMSTVLFERKDVARDVNRGDALHPVTIRRLQEIGAWDAINARKPVPLRRVDLMDRRDRVRVQIDLSDKPLWILNHAEIEEALHSASREAGAEIRAETVQSVTRARRGWTIVGARDQLEATLLVGADGATSRVRDAAGISVRKRDYREAAVVLHGARPEWLEPDHGWALVHPDGGLLLIPTTPAGRSRLVVLIRKDETRSWQAASEDELADKLAARAPRLESFQPTKRGGSHVYRLARQHAARYTAPYLALIGDAAHVTHPNGGQGMNIAIQDACDLAQLAAPVLKDSSLNGLDQALSLYESKRRPVNRRAIARAHRAALLERPVRLNYLAAVTVIGLASRFPRAVSSVVERFGGE